ncbi:transcriptional regulator [Mucilaginibacter robiniae]|uniref:Transcriptional regulator n=1 Tax=Mucilaginibacter robiniae TaxID=2728022 RepID=A0A7L5E374_9SPHI|nr:triple tyrosine motif-containing protein [Mucilaginibacter robiniae]QJD97742.1 transcriptional regulator [Mucilaginibacter robiniae]
MRKIANLFYGLLLFIVLPTIVNATDIKSVGVPFIQNYTKALYQAGNQNWSVTKDEHGIMYFGNSDGLLTYDGQYWQLYHMPNQLIVRSVAADGKGKIYAGGFGEFGYWQNNAQGFLKYHSLINLVPAKYLPNEEIWKIYVDKERVLFQTFSSIYIYEKGRIEVVKSSQSYLFLLKASNRFFVEQVGLGLFELKSNKLSYIPGSNVLSNSVVLSVLPYQSGNFLIGTAKDGLFIYNGQAVVPFTSPVNSFLKTYQLNNGSYIQNKYYAYGTILNGVVIIDTAGNVVQHVNKLSGLHNNTVLGLYTDNNQNLWAALDNGIDRIELNSPLYFYQDKTGKFGTVYSSIIYNDKIYLGTNQGLFYSDWKNKNNGLFKALDFNIISGSQGQVWNLSLIDGRLLCGHNNGTYEVNGTSLKTLSSVSGGWTIKKSNSAQLIQGTYNGLVIYKKDASGNWIFSHQISGFTQPTIYVEQDNEGYLWVSHAYKGVYRIKLNHDLTKAESIKYYDEHYNLPSSYNINVFKLNNDLVYSTEAGFYTYDHITDKFYRYTQLNKMLGTFATSNKVIQASSNQYWFINHGHVALADLSIAGKIKIDSNRFSVLNGQMVQHYENISRINDYLYLISVDDGFVIYNNQGDNQQKYAALPKVLIRKVQNTTNKVVTLSENGTSEIELPFNKNSVRIYYSFPLYQQSKIRFRYILDGYSKTWSEWSTESQKDFTNLNPGTYYFKVKAQVDGKNVSDETSIKIVVLSPWYSSRIAIIIYLLLLIPLYYVVRFLYRKKLIKHQEYLHQKFILEKEEALRKEAALNEQKIIRLKNEQLQADLANKNRELSNSAMNIVYKNELLQKLSDEITHLKDDNGKTLSPEQLRKLQKVIDEGMNDEQDWNIFENSFNEAHENFFKKLKSQHPELVPNDLKLCAYLRMNMSSKEIASLLNITLRGVEIRRYRLRKKLQLQHDKNLSEFLIEL